MFIWLCAEQEEQDLRLDNEQEDQDLRLDNEQEEQDLRLDNERGGVGPKVR